MSTRKQEKKARKAEKKAERADAVARGKAAYREAKYEGGLKRDLSKLKSERAGAKVSRVGLWCIPILGWLFLPLNGKKIRSLDRDIREVEARLRQQ